MKRITILLLYLFVIIYLTGCKQIDNSDQYHQVMIKFDTKLLSGSSPASSTENLVSKVMFFGVNDQNNVVQTIPAMDIQSLSGISLGILRKVKTLFAIANPTESLEKADPQTVLDIMNLTCDFTTAPVSPFVMSGKGDIKDLEVKIDLIRAVAKIEITGIDGFEIEKVDVATPGKGYVFVQEKLSVPFTAGEAKYSAINSTKSPTLTLYIGESAAQKPAIFKLNGTYDGKPATYSFSLMSGGKTIDIVRNTHYHVDIKSITKDACTISINVVDWSDPVETEEHTIPENAFN